QRLQLRAFNNTRIDLHGKITGLPDTDRLRGNLVLGTLQTSRRHILLLSPAGSIPPSITVPEKIALRGSVSGSVASASANLQLLTSLGNAAVKGTASRITDQSRARYDATLTTDRLDLGAILQND